jgi:hypothetical protein
VKPLALIEALMLVLGLFAACGGDDDEPSSDGGDEAAEPSDSPCESVEAPGTRVQGGESRPAAEEAVRR